MWVLDLFASAGFGALTGGVLGFLKTRQETKNLELKQNHEVSMLKATTAANIQLADKQIESNKVKGELAIGKEEAIAFTYSQKTTSFGEAVKSLIRPLITGALLYVSYQLLVNINILVGGLESIPQKELLGLYKIVVLQIFGLTGICVGWWFATRTSKGYEKMMDKHL